YLASLGNSEVARPAFIACITRLPAFYPGWFMLGFLELMNGRVEDARTAWAVLDALPPEDSLRLCADGLLLLAHDEFKRAARQLELALAKNTLHPPLNAYIRSVLKAVHERGSDATPLSPEHHLLLAGYVSSMTRH
ncbi:hypothetical protein, partial [Caballeronia sp. BR00000012568055]|uniref:hypothetical protein n=1 Tax=Caballeronia sp. BR00000012568055 TaxID=2918761 RepID=UPI0023F8C9C7